jgi:cytochrome c-type protein NapB
MKPLFIVFCTLVGLLGYSMTASYAETTVIDEDYVVSSETAGSDLAVSLRGHVSLSDTLPAEEMKKYPKEQTLESSFVFQPPLVPHSIRNYEVSLNANKCLACHGWKNAKEMKATKISVTHFVNREDAVLSDVSPRRYFCVQCHVPQADTQPLVENTFERVDSLR